LSRKLRIHYRLHRILGQEEQDRGDRYDEKQRHPEFPFAPSRENG